MFHFSVRFGPWCGLGRGQETDNKKEKMFVQIFTGSIKSAKIKLIYMSTSPAAPVERHKTKIATHQLCVRVVGAAV